MLSQKQIESVKTQLLTQLESSAVPNKEEIAESIKAMNSEQLEEFLNKNKLIKKNSGCVFCSIIEEKLPSYKINENVGAIAVLDINPISKGHSLIIPKKHSEEISELSLELAKQLAQKISKLLKPKKVDIIESSIFGHKIINLLPIYKDETIHSEKQQASEQDLLNLHKTLSQENKSEEKEENPIPKQEQITNKNTWLPKRIP